MQDIAELERRITAALERITRGVDTLGAAASEAAAPAEDSAEITRLTEALDEERMANAQLNERLRVIRDREAEARAGLEAKIAQLTAELEALHASRAEAVAEMDDILTALTPLIEEASPHA